jgi:hypothetical protein
MNSKFKGLGVTIPFGSKSQSYRTPIIKGPIDSEPGVDKEWRLIWQSP